MILKNVLVKSCRHMQGGRMDFTRQPAKNPAEIQTGKTDRIATSSVNSYRRPYPRDPISVLASRTCTRKCVSS